jgi:DNA-binding Xre family transcriptional regulator
MPDAQYPPEGLIICNLQALMNERGLKPVQVERLTGLSRPTVRKLRTNRFNAVRMTTVARLCSMLKVGVGVLLTHKPIVQLQSESETLVGARK